MPRFLRVLALTLETRAPDAADAVAHHFAEMMRTSEAPVETTSVGMLGAPALDVFATADDEGSRSADALAGLIGAAAQRHGEASDSEAEVGDLQTALAVAFGVMTPEQRAAVLADALVQEVLEWGASAA